MSSFSVQFPSYLSKDNKIFSHQNLENLTSDQKDAISHVLISQKFSPNQNIVNEGDQASSFYIIMEVSDLIFILSPKCFK